MATDMSSQKSSAKLTSPGSMLKRARERAGVSLEHVSDQTLIPVARLAALEKEDFEKVGGSAYVVGYARNAAQAIGVDPEPIVDAYSEILKKMDGIKQSDVELNQAADKPIQPKKGLKVLILAVGTALVAAMLLLVFLLVSGDEDASSKLEPSRDASDPVSMPQDVRSSIGYRSSVDEQVPVVAPSNELKSVQDNEQASQLESTVIKNEIDIEPLPTDEVDVAVEQPETVLPITQSSTAYLEDTLSTNDHQEGYTISEPQVDSTLDVFFTDECWVKVTDATGKRLVARVANAGDHISVSGLTPFDVMLGNARGSSIELNNELISFTPKKGKRTLRLSVGH